MEAPETNGSVKYTVKELLAEIRSDVKAIDAKLDTKADTTDLNDLRVRVGVLEHAQTQTSAEKNYRRWLIVGGPLAILIAVGSIAMNIANLF